MTTPDDQVLVSRCLEGDMEAFGMLIDRYQKPLYNTALRMTGNSEDARDLTQDAFIKAHDKLSTYKPEYKFFSWLYRILINQSINHLKEKRASDGLDLERFPSSQHVDEDYAVSELSVRIDSALAELPFDYRMVIVLRYFNDMSYDEMSDILAVPAKTVKSRLYSARQSLASILNRKGVASW